MQTSTVQRSTMQRHQGGRIREAQGSRVHVVMKPYPTPCPVLTPTSIASPSTAMVGYHTKIWLG